MHHRSAQDLPAWGTWRRALRRGEQEVQSRAAIYLAALPGQLELRTSSGCTPVNAVAAVGARRSWYVSPAAGEPSSPPGVPPDAGALIEAWSAGFPSDSRTMSSA